MILSGILEPKGSEVIQTLSSSRLAPLRRKSEKGWTTLLLQKKR
jgi:ribosomal protein L11 methylase PrmA